MNTINPPRVITSPSHKSKKRVLEKGGRGDEDVGPKSPGRSVADFDLTRAPGHLLRCAHSRARAIFDEIVGRETGLSKQQVALMITIAQNPSATHALLAEESGFDRNTLADTLDRLIVKGLVSRERSRRDARAYEIGLTLAGHAQLESIMPLSGLVQAKIIEPIPAELRETFIRCLQLLAGVSSDDLLNDNVGTAFEETVDPTNVTKAP